MASLSRVEAVAIALDQRGQPVLGIAVAQEPGRLPAQHVLHQQIERELALAVELAVQRVDQLSK